MATVVVAAVRTSLHGDTPPQNALPEHEVVASLHLSFWTCSAIAVSLLQLLLQLISSPTLSFDGTVSNNSFAVQS